MVDQLARGFHCRLTTTFDGVLRKALMDVMNIFENTITDFKVLMKEKDATVYALQEKLLAIQIQLQDHVCESDGESKTNPPLNETATFQAVKRSSSLAKEPDDWCAPLGFEITPKKEAACPSVRLRPLSIPVRNIPINKNEIVKCDLDLYLKSKNRRSSKRLSALKEGTNPFLGAKVSVRPKVPQHPMLTIKQESIDKSNRETRGSKKKTLGGSVSKPGKKSRKAEKKALAKGQKPEILTTKPVQSGKFCVICKKDFRRLVALKKHLLICRKKASVSSETQTSIKTEDTVISISSMDSDTLTSKFIKNARVQITRTMLDQNYIGNYIGRPKLN